MFVEFLFQKKSPDVSSFGVKSSATKCLHLILTLAAADFPNFPVFNTLKVFSSGCNLDYGTRLPRLLYPRKTQIHKCINTQIHKYTNKQIQLWLKLNIGITCAIFLKRLWYEDLKNDVHDYLMCKYTHTNTQIYKYINTQVNKYSFGQSFIKT